MPHAAQRGAGAATHTPPLPPPRVRAVIKLGGSAITDKQQHETLRPDVLASCAAALKQLHTQLALEAPGAPPGVIVVHGAGSFGHFEARAFGVTSPDTPQAQLVEGFVKTRRSVTRLNHLVVSALVDAGVPAVGLSPCGTWAASQRQLGDDAAGLAAVQAVLHTGLVPVLHGDGILEQPESSLCQPGQLACCILSGDTIVQRLAQALRPDFAAFLTDVPGLLSQPPPRPQQQQEQQAGQQPVQQQQPDWGSGVLLPVVRVSPDGSWRACAADGMHIAELSLSTAAHDVSGGIAGKLHAAAAVALGGCPVVIARAGSPSGAAAVLRGPAAFQQPPGGEALQGTVVMRDA